MEVSDVLSVPNVNTLSARDSVAGPGAGCCAEASAEIVTTEPVIAGGANSGMSADDSGFVLVVELSAAWRRGSRR